MNPFDVCQTCLKNLAFRSTSRSGTSRGRMVGSYQCHPGLLWETCLWHHHRRRPGRASYLDEFVKVQSILWLELMSAYKVSDQNYASASFLRGWCDCWFPMQFHRCVSCCFHTTAQPAVLSQPVCLDPSAMVSGNW